METPTERNRYFSALRLELPYVVEALGGGCEFFHQPGQFRFLSEVLADHLRHQAEPPGAFLTAGCDQGLDAYSLAITCLETARNHPGYAFSILATDFLPDNTRRAERGVYPVQTTATLPPDLIKRYFLRSRNPGQSVVRLRPGVRTRIKFRCQDIFERFNLREPMDVIFCRRVLHHFEPRLSLALAQHLRQHLAPGGLLFLGRDMQGLSGFLRVGPSIYQAR